MSLDLSSSFHQFRIPMAEGSKNGIFTFDHFRLDAEKLMLYRDGAEVLIPAKVAKTLVVLVQTAGSILSKDELIDRVWEDSIVEESNLTQYLYLLRKTLGTMPDGRPYIETLRRRGYRFNGAVRRDVVSDAASRESVKPSVAAAPVQSSHGSVEREGNVLRVVDWKPSEGQPTKAPESIAAAAAPPARRSRLSTVAVAGAILLLVGAGGVFVWSKMMPAVTDAESRKELSILKLTNGPYPFGATISRDGNVFVYHEADGDVSRMFIQQTGQSSRIEITSSRDKVYGAKVFSPDGQQIYFVAIDVKSSLGSLFRIPAMGGSPVKLFDDIHGTVTFSPDGREMAFCRWNPKTGEKSLLIADKDGKSERIVLQRREPRVLQPSTAWSPDGKSIAFAEADVYEGKPGTTTRLYLLDIATGRVSQLSNEDWDNVLRMIWMPDGSGIIMIGTRENESLSTRRDQLYFVSYPDGVSQRITNDGNRHEPDSLGVTSKGDVLAVPSNRSTQIWTLNADGNPNSAVQLTRGVGDGRAGLGPLPDGSFGFLARNADDIDIMLSNPDASVTKELPTGLQFVEELRADPLGRFFVFSSYKERKHHLYRIDVDGGGLRQLTFGSGNEIDSAISPDGKYIAFHSETQIDGSLKNILLRIPAAGGDIITLHNKTCLVPTYSPDGSMISCVSDEKPAILIISATDGSEVERHPLPTFATWNFGIGWTPDGSGLMYIINEKGTSNIMVQPRNGSKPKYVTNFSSGIIYRYAYSADGTKLILARGYPTQDVILVKNFR
jgi:Tol biopolymer transport system component/DNA-binding winged helix-turn-helix (wHTH) protein